MTKEINQTIDYLKTQGIESPEVGIILGTGLGALTNHIESPIAVSYSDIPNFPLATVESHNGKLIYGDLAGKKVLAMSGRFHFYEGYSMTQVVYPVRVMKFLGIKQLLVSNAGGCMNLDWKKGELMLIDDHINMQPDNPLRGPEAVLFGPIFTDLSCPYDPYMNSIMEQVSQEENIPLNKGVYVSVPGPSLETRAEYRFLRNAGADAVGMSTVPEVIAANQMSLPVSAVTVLTDECDPDNLKPVDIGDIIATAGKAEAHLVKLFQEVIKRI